MRAISRSRLLRAVHLPVVSHFEMQNEFASATVSINRARDAEGEAAKHPRISRETRKVKLFSRIIDNLPLKRTRI